MITDADVEKLLAVRSARATMLSLYLGLPSRPPALRGLPARAEELISEAARADGNDAGRACSGHAGPQGGPGRAGSPELDRGT